MSLWIVTIALATIAGIGMGSRFGGGSRTTDDENNKADNRLSNVLFVLGGVIELYLRDHRLFHVAAPQPSDKFVWMFNVLAIIFIALACFIRQW
jgi:hypothetical protein